MDLKYFLFSLPFGLIALGLILANFDAMGPGAAFATAACSFAAGVLVGLSAQRRTKPSEAEKTPRSSLD